MDPVILAKAQFAFTVMYHFIFVPISIGLSLMLVLAERRYRKSGDAADRAASDFLIKLFAATFAIGVATGVTMEFAFGTNWAVYSRFVGDIFGAPLAAEGVFAFFLESTFLGILLFGRSRVSKRFYYVSTWLVMFGSMLSALWIIIANSWMQTPAGYKIEGGRAVLTDFFAAAINYSTLPRYTHTLAATLVMGAFVAAAVSAWYLLKGRHADFAKKVMPAALIVGLIAALLVPLTGDWSGVQVAETQPVKLAAFEGQYKTQAPAPLYIAGWTDQTTQQTSGIAIPGMLSLLVGHNLNTTIKGLDTFPKEVWPPVNATFQTYHLMILMAGCIVLVAVLGLFFWWRGSLDKQRWLLWLLVISPVFPFLAIQGGWAAAEIGRQPWIVYNVLRTDVAVSSARNVPAGAIMFTLALFVIIYAILLVGWIRIFFGIIRKGPDTPAGAGVREPVPTPVGSGSAKVMAAAKSDTEGR